MSCRRSSRILTLAETESPIEVAESSDAATAISPTKAVNLSPFEGFSGLQADNSWLSATLKPPERKNQKASLARRGNRDLNC
jgi:hypothetical protein